MSFREPRLLLRVPPPLWVLATGERMSAEMMMMTESLLTRWCGRWMALPNDPAPTPTITYSAVNSGTTLCTKLVPFRLRVHFDDGEVRALAFRFDK